MGLIQQAYTAVPTEEKATSGNSHLVARQSDDNYPRCLNAEDAAHRNRRRIQDITCVFVLTLLATVTFQWTYHYLSYDPQHVFDNARVSLYSEGARLHPKYHCGNSSAEARALGCIFDLGLVGYVPAPCFEADLNQRFMDWGWRFFEDQDGTKEVSLERIEESAGTREPFWAQHGYHITHCELAWERMHRALQGGKRLTTHMLNLEHTRHCGMMTEMRDDFYSLNSQILPLLNTC